MEKLMMEKMENRLTDIQFERLSAINKRNLLWAELIDDLCEADLSNKAMRIRKKSVELEIEYWGERTVQLENEALEIVNRLAVK